MEPGSSKPLISIITVVYNGAHALESTIQGVIEQTYTDIEYIIIDGGSQDGTVDIIKKYEQKITRWISEKDQGIYDAMNKGLRHARGEWVYFLNCQDYFYSRTVLSEVAPYLRSANGSVFSGKVEMTNGSIIKLYPEEYKDKRLSARALFHTKFCHQALFVKREAYISHGLFNLTFKVFSDFDLIYNIISGEGDFAKASIIITKFDPSGISNDWRYSVRHFREREAIFVRHGNGSNRLLYFLRYLKAHFYYLRKLLINSFKRK